MTINAELYDFAVDLILEHPNAMWINPKPLRHEVMPEDDEIHQELIKNKRYLPELNRFFFHASNDAILAFEKNLKKEHADTLDDGYNYLDLEIFQCILHAQKCLRWREKYFDLALLGEISNDYRRAVKEGVRLGLDDAFLLERAKSIFVA